MNLPTPAERAAAAQARELGRQNVDQRPGDGLRAGQYATTGSDDGRPESWTAQQRDARTDSHGWSAPRCVDGHPATEETTVGGVRRHEYEPVPTYEETMRQDGVRYSPRVRDGASGDPFDR